MGWEVGDIMKPERKVQCLSRAAEKKGKSRAQYPNYAIRKIEKTTGRLNKQDKSK